MFEFADPENPTIRVSIVSIFCTELKSVQFVFFCLILFAIATSLAPSEIQVAYLNLTTPYNLLYMKKIPRFLATT